jgi:hypothetical protein
MPERPFSCCFRVSFVKISNMELGKDMHCLITFTHKLFPDSLNKHPSQACCMKQRYNPEPGEIDTQGIRKHCSNTPM